MRSLGETKLTNQSELLGQKEIDIFSLPSRRPLRPRKVALFWRPERVLVTTPHQTSSSKINMLSRRDLLVTVNDKSPNSLLYLRYEVHTKGSRSDRQVGVQQSPKMKANSKN